MTRKIKSPASSTSRTTPSTDTLALAISNAGCEGIEADHWQTDTSISNLSWGYIEHDELKTPDFLIHQLIDIVSKNGNLLLNIGPRPDGTIPDEVRSTLLQIGAWLKQNGAAIYDTTPWKVYGEGPTKVKAGFGNDKETKPYTSADFRFTQKGTTIYAIAMAWPPDGHFVIHALGSAQQAKDLSITAIELLGSSAKLDFHQSPDALDIQVPDSVTPPGKFAFAFRLSTAITSLAARH